MRPRGSSLSFRRPAAAPSDPLRNDVGHRACEDLESQGAHHCARQSKLSEIARKRLRRHRDMVETYADRLRKVPPQRFTPDPGPWSGSPGAFESLKMGLHALGEKSRWAFRSFCLHRRRLSPLPRPPLPAAAVTQPGRRRRNRLAPPPPVRRRLAPAARQRQRRRRTAGAAAQSQRGVGSGRGRHAGGTMAAAAGGCAPPSPHPRSELVTRGGYGARGFPTAAPRSAGRCRPAPLAAVAPS